MTGVADNILVLRYVEQRARLRRLVSVLKMREGPYDTAAHELRISDRGFEVESTPEGAGGLLADAEGEPAPAASPRSDESTTPPGSGTKRRT